MVCVDGELRLGKAVLFEADLTETYFSVSQNINRSHFMSFVSLSLLKILEATFDRPFPLTNSLRIRKKKLVKFSMMLH